MGVDPAGILLPEAPANGAKRPPLGLERTSVTRMEGERFAVAGLGGALDMLSGGLVDGGC